MVHRRVVRASLLAAVLLYVPASAAQASPYYWTDWIAGDTCPASPCVGINGTMTTPTTTVGVSYLNNQGIGFLNSGAPGETDYWSNGNAMFSLTRTLATSPYTSTTVDNIPTGTDMIALQFAGEQRLTFSVPIANPVFAFTSLNFNGYSFRNQDFEILSLAGFDGNNAGYWGCGPAQRVVVNPFSPGNPTADTLYQLNQVGSGCGVAGVLQTEPHGTIRFLGTFSELVWTSQSNEFWNGFTVGIQGTAREVFPDPSTPVPEPGTLVLIGTGIAIAAIRLRRRR